MYEEGSNSVKEGIASEDLFVKTSKKYFWNTRPGTKENNMYDHIDYFMECGTISLAIDVKAQRRANRKDPNASPNFTWIKLQNVAGGKGSLYGKADYLFLEYWKDKNGQLVGKYLGFPRDLLRRFIEQKVQLLNNPKRINNADLLEFEAYQRDGNKDIIVKVTYDTLRYFARNIDSNESLQMLYFDIFICYSCDRLRPSLRLVDS